MIFKYFKDRKLRKEKIAEDARIREEKFKRIRNEEKNRKDLLIPQKHVRNILGAYDAYKDSEKNRHENKYDLWLHIEKALPETKKGNWFITVAGSNIISIREILHPPGVTHHSGYVDIYWESKRKKRNYL